ncbi:hypothetical protein KEM48_006411 [Puccinia striiformis f. sp. tritici PST-130]|nr:hypothetical protein KEM48_006411 [Puccinia striiformis f. sp. tritici PST-130]
MAWILSFSSWELENSFLLSSLTLFPQDDPLLTSMNLSCSLGSSPAVGDVFIASVVEFNFESPFCWNSVPHLSSNSHKRKTLLGPSNLKLQTSKRVTCQLPDDVTEVQISSGAYF